MEIRVEKIIKKYGEVITFIKGNWKAIKYDNIFLFLGTGEDIVKDTSMFFFKAYYW